MEAKIPGKDAWLHRPQHDQVTQDNKVPHGIGLSNGTLLYEISGREDIEARTFLTSYSTPAANRPRPHLRDGKLK
jgi:hypothetical protein